MHYVPKNPLPITRSFGITPRIPRRVAWPSLVSFRIHALPQVPALRSLPSPLRLCPDLDVRRSSRLYAVVPSFADLLGPVRTTCSSCFVGISRSRLAAFLYSKLSLGANLFMTLAHKVLGAISVPFRLSPYLCSPYIYGIPTRLPASFPATCTSAIPSAACLTSWCLSGFCSLEPGPCSTLGGGYVRQAIFRSHCATSGWPCNGPRWPRIWTAPRCARVTSRCYLPLDATGTVPRLHRLSTSVHDGSRQLASLSTVVVSL